MPSAPFDLYDPWYEYERSKKKAGESPPYLSLLNLLDDIRPEVRFHNSTGRSVHYTLGLPYDTNVNRLSTIPRIDAISERAVNRIIEWTNRHGPLGILQQRLLMFRSTIVEPNGRRRQANFTRMGLSGFWMDFGGEYAFTIEDTAETDDSCVLFPKATEPHWLNTDVAPVLANFGMQADRVLLESFFEGVTDLAPLYSEPIADWFSEAEDLYSIIKVLRSSSRKSKPPGYASKERALNHLLGSAGYHYRFDSAGVRRQMFYPSLLAVFAAMFAQDLMDHEKRLITCPVCGALAASSSYRRTYCSKTCAWRARKRKQRANAKKETPSDKRRKR